MFESKNESAIASVARPAIATVTKKDIQLSIVVINYRTWGETERLLDLLQKETDASKHEILVVNNCHRTRLPEPMTKIKGIRFVESVRNVGFSGAVNLAAACAESRKLLILNPDILPHAGAIQAILETHKRNNTAGIIVPRLVHEDGQDQDSVRTFYRAETIIAARTPWGRTKRGRQILKQHMSQEMDRNIEQPVDWALGAAMLVDLDRVPNDQGRIMDERFFLYMEDVDLCLRTWQAGRQVMYAPQAIFTHSHKRESRKRPFSLANLRHLLSLIKFAAKYRGLPSRPTG